ncbi:MAG: peptide chain release factor N(5)-glutamine methyltransferase [Dichotomicrobium sp.]
MPEPRHAIAAVPSTEDGLEAIRRSLTRAFASRGAATPALDARLLLMAACGLDHAELIRAGDRPLSDRESARLDSMVRRRLGGEPVSRILGQRAFWGLDFRLSEATLDPRPDTETLVEAVLTALPARERESRSLRVLDLGTGTGCILTALLHELPRAAGVGTDTSHAALLIARGNAQRNGIGNRAHFVRADWLNGIRGPFDVVVVNPPYIPRHEIAGLARDVRDHDPAAALDGGADGLDAYRAILGGLGNVLASGGIAAFEVGMGQAAAVGAMMTESGLTPALQHGTFSQRDLAGIERVLVARHPDVGQIRKKQLESGAIHDSLV